MEGRAPASPNSGVALQELRPPCSWTTQRFEFAFCENAPMTARQIAEAKISDPSPHEALHFITNFMEHAPNLPINSLSQDDAQSRRVEQMKPHNSGTLAI